MPAYRRRRFIGGQTVWMHLSVLMPALLDARDLRALFRPLIRETPIRSTPELRWDNNLRCFQSWYELLLLYWATPYCETLARHNYGLPQRLFNIQKYRKYGPTKSPTR